MLVRNVLLVAVLLTLPFSLYAREIRVPKDSATIQAAVDLAQPGDVILIAPGVYEGDVRIEGRRDLTIRGDFVFTPPSGEPCCGSLISGKVASVVIKGTIFILRSSNVVVEGLTVTGPESGFFIQGTTLSPVRKIVIRYVAAIRNARHGAELVGNVTDVYLLCSTFSYNCYDGIVLDQYVSSVVIETCEVSYNGQCSATGVGIRIGAQAKDVVIKDNCIIGNAFAGIHPQ